MKLLTVDTIEQAREKIMAHICSWTRKIKSLPLEKSNGCILAENIISSCDIPSFRRSTVDGYAVIASDTSAATDSIPVFLKLTGSVSMGKEANFLISSGECAYVPTGGMLPQNATAVVMTEYCEAAGEIISVYEAAASGSGTAEAGEDFQKGKLLLKRGTFIRPQEIGAMSAAGIINVNVYTPLAISILSTGDELVPPEKDPAPGEVRDINTNLLKSLAEDYGYHVVSANVFPDDEAQLETAIKEAIQSSDIVLISGGSSQGEKDFTAMLIDRIAKPGVFTHGLALRPGKPTILGWDEESKTLLAGLPGHPVSAMMVFKLLFESLQIELLYIKSINNPHIASSSTNLFSKKSFPIPARINSNIPGSPGKSVCLPVILKLENNSYLAEPVFGKSGMISTLTRADGYIIIDINKEGLKKDELVMVHLF